MSNGVNIAADVIMLIGAALALLAAVGLLKFKTATARFHAAGKASPVAFLITSIGAGISLGWIGSAALALAVFAMTLTLPIGVHLLFRAVHNDGPNDHLSVDDLARAKAAVMLEDE